MWHGCWGMACRRFPIEDRSKYKHDQIYKLCQSLGHIQIQVQVYKKSLTWPAAGSESDSVRDKRDLRWCEFDTSLSSFSWQTTGFKSSVGAMHFCAGIAFGSDLLTDDFFVRVPRVDNCPVYASTMVLIIHPRLHNQGLDYGSSGFPRFCCVHQLRNIVMARAFSSERCARIGSQVVVWINCWIGYKNTC